jgi:hypothetical protein
VHRHKTFSNFTASGIHEQQVQFYLCRWIIHFFSLQICVINASTLSCSYIHASVPRALKHPSHTPGTICLPSWLRMLSNQQDSQRISPKCLDSQPSQSVLIDCPQPWFWPGRDHWLQRYTMALNLCQMQISHNWP